MAKKRRRNNYKLVTLITVAILLVITAFVGKFLGFDISDGFKAAGLRDTTVTQGKMYVNFIDIGQGDCTLITCGDYEILIDGGESGQSQTVINYLKNHNIKDIDCLVATHPHSDHIGSLAKVMAEFEIKQIIMPVIPEKIIPTTGTYKKFLSAAKKYANEIIPATAGETYSFGEMKMEILAPINDYDNLNDMSVVARISYGNTSVMMTGDAGFSSENDIISKYHNISSDLLKVGHHGSATSTSDKWLSAVKPKYAVISCGEGNDYGHPHKELVSRLEKHLITYYRTDLIGNIVFESDGNTFLKCE